MEIERNPLFIGEIGQLRMDISETAYARLDPSWDCPNGQAAITRVYFVLRGAGVLTSARETVTMTPGNIYIIPTGMSYAYRCDEYLEKLYCHVNLVRYRHEDLFEGCDRFITLAGRDATVAEAEACYRAGDAMSAVRLRSILWQTLWEGLARAEIAPAALREYSPLVRQAITYIEDNLRAGLSAAEIAAALFVSDGYLQKVFRRETGEPLGRYITNRVLATAERELRLTRRPVREISDSLGFCDRFYFSRLFFRRYNLPPAQYRKNVSL